MGFLFCMIRLESVMSIMQAYNNIRVASIFTRYENNRKRKYANCLCFCGAEYTIRYDSISRSKGCGCIVKEEYRKRLIEQNKKRANGADGQKISAYKCLMNVYKNTCAKQRGLKFELTFDAFYKLVTQDCYYCGIEPLQTATYRKTGFKVLYNGVDRLDSSLGYTEDNVVTCCKRCNYAKQDVSYESFIYWIKKVYANVIQNNL